MSPRYCTTRVPSQRGAQGSVRRLGWFDPADPVWQQNDLAAVLILVMETAIIRKGDVEGPARCLVWLR
jgi:hypothetical protein